MTLKHFQEILLPAIEVELKKTIERIDREKYPLLVSMMSYHLGWEGENAGPKATGKRIRPFLVLLTCSAAGGDWKRALPAAVSVELIHNFSLLHDDIEDRSALRRGRPTVWKLWGIPQAINTGDAMFSLAHLSMLDLEKTSSHEACLNASKIIQNACLALTKGQFLDISYEDKEIISIEDYWLMIGGKTAALISTCTELGAILSGTKQEVIENYRTFGNNLGLAFQVLDDLLGIWGDSLQIGKSNKSDLVTRKKTLPILYGLQNNDVFADKWKHGKIKPDEVADIARQLEIEGARDYAKQEANRLTQTALEAFYRARPSGEAGKALEELTNSLLNRNK